MRFTSYIPALDVLTTQLDSLSKPSRPQYVKNLIALNKAGTMPIQGTRSSLWQFFMIYKDENKRIEYKGIVRGKDS